MARIVLLGPVECVCIVGKDTARFANGMFTNHAEGLAVGDGQRTAMCDDKGRPFGLMQLYRVAEHAFTGILEGMTFDEFESRYAKYVLFDDVVIERDPRRVASVTGEGAEALVAAIGRDTRRSWSDDGGVAVARHDRAGPGWDLLTTDPDGLLARLVAAGAQPGTYEELETARVERGRIRWPADAPGRFLLHELGLRDEVCHFEKGCYVGQEVIHRVEVLGETKRAFVGVRVDGDAPVENEAEIRAGGGVVGKLTSPVRSARFGWIGLAVVRKPHDAVGTRVEVGAPPRAATISALPFAP